MKHVEQPSVKLFMFRRCINGEWFCVVMPCEGWEGAEADAERFGWQLDGLHLGTAPSWLPVPLAMAWIRLSRWFSPVLADKIETKETPAN